MPSVTTPTHLLAIRTAHIADETEQFRAQCEIIHCWEARFLTASTLLGLQPGYTSSDLKKAGRLIQLSFHPDKNPSSVEHATAAFNILKEALNFLSDKSNEHNRFHQIEFLHIRRVTDMPQPIKLTAASPPVAAPAQPKAAPQPSQGSLDEYKKRLQLVLAAEKMTADDRLFFRTAHERYEQDQRHPADLQTVPDYLSTQINHVNVFYLTLAKNSNATFFEGLVSRSPTKAREVLLRPVCKNVDSHAWDSITRAVQLGRQDCLKIIYDHLSALVFKDSTMTKALPLLCLEADDRVWSTLEYLFVSLNYTLRDEEATLVLREMIANDGKLAALLRTHDFFTARGYRLDYNIIAHEILNKNRADLLMALHHSLSKIDAETLSTLVECLTKLLTNKIITPTDVLRNYPASDPIWQQVPFVDFIRIRREKIALPPNGQRVSTPLLDNVAWAHVTKSLQTIIHDYTEQRSYKGKSPARKAQVQQLCEILSRFQQAQDPINECIRIQIVRDAIELLSRIEMAIAAEPKRFIFARASALKKQLSTLKDTLLTTFSLKDTAIGRDPLDPEQMVHDHEQSLLGTCSQYTVLHDLKVAWWTPHSLEKIKQFHPAYFTAEMVFFLNTIDPLELDLDCLTTLKTDQFTAESAFTLETLRKRGQFLSHVNVMFHSNSVLYALNQAWWNETSLRNIQHLLDEQHYTKDVVDYLNIIDPSALDATLASYINGWHGEGSLNEYIQRCTIKAPPPMQEAEPPFMEAHVEADSPPIFTTAPEPVDPGLGAAWYEPMDQPPPVVEQETTEPPFVEVHVEADSVPVFTTAPSPVDPEPSAAWHEPMDQPPHEQKTTKRPTKKDPVRTRSVPLAPQPTDPKPNAKQPKPIDQMAPLCNKMTTAKQIYQKHVEEQFTFFGLIRRVGFYKNIIIQQEIDKAISVLKSNPTKKLDTVKAIIASARQCIVSRYGDRSRSWFLLTTTTSMSIKLLDDLIATINAVTPERDSPRP